MYQTLIEWMRRMATWQKARALLPRELRRSAYQIVVRRQRANQVRRAFAGTMANMQDIENFVIAKPVRLQVPLVLVSQAQRSGGTLLSQLFDGHPALAAHPQELKIGYPSREDWPPLDPALGPDRNLEMIYEANTIMLMKRGYTKGDRDPDRRRFFLVPRIQYRVFHHLFETTPPTSRREILDHFFTSYFNAWLNYQGNLEEKRWITAFAPRVAHHEASVTGLFDSYPDGRLIQVIRDPRSWYPSAKHHGKSGPVDKTADQIMSMWCTSAESMLRNKANYGDRVIVLRFEDLVGKTEQTMRSLAAELGIAYAPILTEPTFNGETMRANSSFAVETRGVIDAPLKREQTLTVDERKLIEQRCMRLYEAATAAVMKVAA